LGDRAVLRHITIVICAFSTDPSAFDTAVSDCMVFNRLSGIGMKPLKPFSVDRLVNIGSSGTEPSLFPQMTLM
jgi:hypothetical protein